MRKSTFILAIIFLTLFCESCSSPLLAKTETVTFMLPDSPSPSLVCWKIETHSSSESTSFTTKENSFSVSLPKTSPYSVLAYPITELADGSKVSFYKPAGIIYPYTFNPQNKTQLITWEGGFSASLMNRLIANGIEQKLSSTQIESFISSFNWQKLLNAISTKCEESLNDSLNNPDSKFYNPWQIDSTRLLENLSNRSFSSTYLDLTYQYTVNTDTISTNLESSYVPQNKIIEQSKTVTLKKDSPELLLSNNFYGVYISGSSAKNISLQFIYMPIIKEAL